MKRILFLVIATVGFSAFSFAQSGKAVKQEELMPQKYDPNPAPVTKVDPKQQKATAKETNVKNDQNPLLSLGLTDAQMTSVNELNKTVAQKKAAINASEKLTSGEKKEQIKQMEIKVTQRLKEVLGTKYDSYINATKKKG